MAKALYGHLTSPVQDLIAEIVRLRQRVRELEAEVQRLELERNLDLTRIESDLLQPALH